MKPRPTVQPTINKFLLLGYHVLCEHSHCSVSNLLHGKCIFVYVHTYDLGKNDGPGAWQEKPKTNLLPSFES